MDFPNTRCDASMPWVAHEAYTAPCSHPHSRSALYPCSWVSNEHLMQLSVSHTAILTSLLYWVGRPHITVRDASDCAVCYMHTLPAYVLIRKPHAKHDTVLCHVIRSSQEWLGGPLATH
jgi:hypothetical protein